MTARGLVEEGRRAAEEAYAEALAEHAALASSAEAARLSASSANKAATRTEAAAKAAAAQRDVAVAKAAEEAITHGKTPGLQWPATAAEAAQAATTDAATSASCAEVVLAAVATAPSELVEFVGGAEARSAKDVSTTKAMREAVAQLLEAIAKAEAKALAEKHEEEEAERKLEEEEVRRHQEGMERQAALAAKRKAELEQKTAEAAARARAAQTDAADVVAAAAKKADEAAAKAAAAGATEEEAARLSAAEQSKRDAAYAAAKAKRDKMLGFTSSDAQFRDFIQSDAGSEVRASLVKLGFSFSRASSPRSRARSPSSPGGRASPSSPAEDEDESGDEGGAGPGAVDALGPVPRPWSGASEMSGPPPPPPPPPGTSDAAAEAALAEALVPPGAAGGARLASRSSAREEASDGRRKPPLPEEARPRSRGGVRRAVHATRSMLGLRSGSAAAAGRAGAAAWPDTPSNGALFGGGYDEGGPPPESGPRSFWPPASEMDRSWTSASHIPWMLPPRGAATSKAKLRLLGREKLAALRREVEAARQAAEAEEAVFMARRDAQQRGGSEGGNEHGREHARSSTLPSVTSQGRGAAREHASRSAAALPAPSGPAVATTPAPQAAGSGYGPLRGAQSQPSLGIGRPRPVSAPEVIPSPSKLANASAASVASSVVGRPQTVGGGLVSSTSRMGLLQLPPHFYPTLAAEAALSSATGRFGSAIAAPPRAFAPKYGSGVRAMLRAQQLQAIVASALPSQPAEPGADLRSQSDARLAADSSRQALSELMRGPGGGAAKGDGGGRGGSYTFTTERLDDRFSPMRPGWAPGP